jgi:hypothetical protein
MAPHSQSPLGSHQQALDFFGLKHSVIDAHNPLPNVVMDAAHAVHAGWALSRLAPVLTKLNGSSADCCLHIMTLGGSVMCGVGHPTGWQQIKAFNSPWFPSKWKRSFDSISPGINHTWANALVEYLDSRSSSCCPAGHRLRNMCQAGVATSFYVQTFEARVLRAFREDPADLVIVDIATNDVNAVFLSISRGGHVDSVANRLDTEALIRKLLLLSPTAPAIMYAESAWFDPNRFPGRKWGGWPDHKSVLEHYGIPTTFWTHALAQNPHRPANVSRLEVIADALHPSRRGHEVCAYFLVELMLAERKRLEQLPAAERAQLAVQAATLPTTYAQKVGGTSHFEKLLDILEPPLTHVDFTDNKCWMDSRCSLTWRRLFPRLLDSAKGEAAPAAEPRWEWTMLRKSAQGRYEETAWHNAPRLAQAADKWGFMARVTGATFATQLNISRVLRVGYLRSYSGDANVSVRMECDGHEAQLFTLSRRWEVNASIYASETLRLVKEEAGTGAAPAHPNIWSVTFTLQPGASSSFTLYSLTSA